MSDEKDMAGYPDRHETGAAGHAGKEHGNRQGAVADVQQ
jgi:hypothetical protein